MFLWTWLFSASRWSSISESHTVAVDHSLVAESLSQVAHTVINNQIRSILELVKDEKYSNGF